MNRYVNQTDDSEMKKYLVIPSAKLVAVSPDMTVGGENQYYLADEVEAEITALREQLPEGMKHCTIIFKECDKGHGWLTAKNWIQHGCPTCESNELRERLARVRKIAISIHAISKYQEVSFVNETQLFPLSSELLREVGGDYWVVAGELLDQKDAELEATRAELLKAQEWNRQMVEKAAIDAAITAGSSPE